MAFVFDTPGAGFVSLNLQAKKDVVKAFLEWTDGLASRPSNAKPIVIVTCCINDDKPIGFLWIFIFPAILGNFSQQTGPYLALATEKKGYGHESAKQH